MLLKLKLDLSLSHMFGENLLSHEPLRASSAYSVVVDIMSLLLNDDVANMLVFVTASVASVSVVQGESEGIWGIQSPSLQVKLPTTDPEHDLKLKVSPFM